MTIYLRKTMDDDRVVNKTETLLKTITAEPYNGCDIYSPTFILDYDSDIYQANRFEVLELGREYFLRDVVLDSGGRMILMGDIDVLTTYALSLINLKMTVIRNEFVQDTQLIDTAMTFSPKRNISVLQFPNTPFNSRNTQVNDRNFVLCVAGGFTQQ